MQTPQPHRPHRLSPAEITLAAGILSFLGIAFLIESARRFRRAARHASFPIDAGILQKITVLALLLSSNALHAKPCESNEDLRTGKSELLTEPELPQAWRDTDTQEAEPSIILAFPASAWATDKTAPAKEESEATFADAPRILFGVIGESSNAVAWSFAALLLSLIVAVMGTAFTFGRRWGHVMGHHAGWTNRDELAALQEKAQQEKWEATHGLDNIDAAQAAA